MIPSASAATVAYQGEPGAFSEDAVRAVRPGAHPSPRRSFTEVVRAVESGEAGAGLLPVENTLAGAVTASYDALAASRLEVRAEVVIPIRLALLGVSGSTLGSVREAASHPVALSQCARFFAEHPGIAPVVVDDTAGAARDVARRADPARAAIASARVAELLGLTVIAPDLQDRPDNQTRFYLVADPRAPRARSEQDEAPSGYKTALVVEAVNRPGALHDLLGAFARRSLDLTHIESRPAETPWTYRFVLEVAHSAADGTRDALTEVSAVSRGVRVLGVFPAWTPGRAVPETLDVAASAR